MVGKNMNTAAVVIGAILLFSGVVFALIAYPTMKDYETTSGQLVRAVSKDAQEEYENAVMMFWAGSCCGLIGGIILLIGLVMNSEQKKAPKIQLIMPPTQVVYQRPPQPQIPRLPPPPPPQHIPPMPQAPPPPPRTPCPSCGNPIETNWKMCPICGRSL